MHRRYKTTYVMAEHLTERFVNLCRARLASEPVSELRFNHVESSFHVRALVITLHKALLIVREVVIHLFPERGLLVALAAALRAVSLERDVGHRIGINNGLHVLRTAIRLICADFIHHEVAGGRFY